MNRVAKHMPCSPPEPIPHSIETQIWQRVDGYAITAIIREGSKPVETHVWLWSAGREDELREQITSEAAANFIAQPQDRTAITYRIAAVINSRIREATGTQ